MVTELKTGIATAMSHSQTGPRRLIHEIAELAQMAKEGLIGLEPLPGPDGTPAS